MSKNTPALSATGQAVPPGSGLVRKIIVNTHSSGVIRLNDSPNSAIGRVILNDYTLPTGAQSIDIQLDYSEGVFLTIVSGTATIQLGYEPTIN
jgi:hypothetical protein